ncbi:MAG: LamG-like jellyroll fold domain-containing protein, partial [Solirubrobacteraceae bacterium]|nr:LamG-like jellyroll fold domain-containing protein [Solirubrobacteraceae bacterium]
RNVQAEELVTGRFGKALRLSTAGNGRQGFDVDDPARLLEPASVSVLAWVKRADTPTRDEIIVAKSGDDCEVNAYALATDPNGGLSFSVGTARQGGGVEVWPSPTVPPTALWDDKWHAIAGTFDASTGTVSIAVDGKVQGSRPTGGSPIAYGNFSQRRLSVAHYPTDCGFWEFGGQIDDVRVYGRALASAELARLHTVDAAITEPPSLVSPTPNPTPTATPQPTPTPTPTSAPAPAPAPTPVANVPVPSFPNPVPFVKAVRPGAVTAGTGSSVAAPKALQSVIKTIEAKMLSSLIKPPSKSEVVKQQITMSSKEAKRLEVNQKLSEQIKKLKFGLPVKVSVPDGGMFVDVAACVAVQTKDGKKIQGTTVVLPPVVLPVKNGKAEGIIPVDSTAAKALAKDGAVKAAVCTTSAVIDTLPGSTAEGIAKLRAKVEQQQKATEKLGQAGDKIAELQKKLDRVPDDQAKTKDAVEADLRDAEQKARELQGDSAKAAQQAMDEMIKQIIAFTKELQAAQSQQIRALTRV